MSAPWRDIPLVDTTEVGTTPWRDIPLQDVTQVALHKGRVEPEEGDRAAEMSQLLLKATEPALPVSLAVEAPKTRVQRILDDAEESRQLAEIQEKPELAIRAPTPEEQIDEENERYYNAQAERGYGMGAMGGRPAGGFMAKATAPEPKEMEEITPQEADQARLYFVISDLVNEKGAHGAKKYLKNTGMLQKEPIVERFFNAVVGKEAGITEDLLLTDPERVAADLAGTLAGFYLPVKIVGTAGVTGRTVLRLRRARLPEKLAEMGGRATGMGATFGLRGAQEATAQGMSPEEAASHITNQTLFGAGLGGTLAVPNKAIRVPATAMYGYLVKRLEGASQVDAALTGAVFMFLGLMTRRDISFEVKDALLSRGMKQLDAVLTRNGYSAEMSKAVQKEMFSRYARKVNPTLDDFIKLEDDLAALIRKEGRYAEFLKELPAGKAEPAAPGKEVVPRIAGKPPLRPAEALKPAIRPEVPAKPEVPVEAPVAKTTGPLFATGKGRFADQTILDPRRADEMPALQAITGVSAAKDYPGLLEGVKWGRTSKSPVGSYDIVSRDKAAKQDYDIMDMGELPPSFIVKYGAESVMDKTGRFDFDKLAALAENELRDVVNKEGEYAEGIRELPQPTGEERRVVEPREEEGREVVREEVREKPTAPEEVVTKPPEEPKAPEPVLPEVAEGAITKPRDAESAIRREPQNLEEATKLYAAAGPIDPELVRAGIREAQSFGVATKKVGERLVRRGTTHMRKLGEGGIKLAKDIDEIAFNVQHEANNDALDIRKIMKGLTPKERIRVAMVTDNEVPASTQSERIVERSDRLRKVLDRQLKEFAEVGGQRRLGGPGSEKIPAGGGGRAFPQVPNKEGRAVLQEVAAGAMKPGWDMTPKVAKAVEWLVENGWAKNYDEAVYQLIQNKETQLRSVNPYFERTRTPLPTYLREWDPYKVLSGSMERNWMTIEGIRKWGVDARGESFPRANELIGKIAQEHPTDAEVVHQFIRSSFGFGSKASESTQRISRDLRAVQFVGKIAVSPLTITRNMIDRFAKGYTTGGLSITLRATLKFPPFVNVFIKSARQIKDQMIRSGAVFSHGSIAEGVEPGGIIMKMVGKPFTSSERGNQVFEALVAKLRLERDIQLYLNVKPKSRLGEIFNAIQSLGENTETQITNRIKEAGLANKTTQEMVDMLAKSKGADLTPIEVQAVMHRIARDQAFPVILSTKRLWWEDSPFLKVLAQFKVWPIEQIGFIYRSAIKQAIKGNVLPLMRFIIGVIIAGELYNIARDTVYEKEEALLTNLRRRPDKRNPKDIAWILYKDALDGGLIGMFADLTWGVTDWVLGPTAGTIGELGKTMLSALRRPGLTVNALKKAIRRDVSAIRQAEGILNKIGVLIEKDGRRAVLYNRWRFRANEYWREQHVGLYEKIEKAVMGPPSYPVGKNSLTYELIARNITANDIESAAEYIVMLYSKEDAPEERKKIRTALKQSRSRRSPLGPVALKNRREFLDTFAPKEYKDYRDRLIKKAVSRERAKEQAVRWYVKKFKKNPLEDKDEAVKLQKAWLADYNRAIKLVIEEKRIPRVSKNE